MPTFHGYSVRFAWALLASLLIHLVLIGDIVHLPWRQLSTPSNAPSPPPLEVRLPPTPDENKFSSVIEKVKIPAQARSPTQAKPDVRILAASPILESVISIDPPEAAPDTNLAKPLETPSEPTPLKQNNDKFIQRLPPSGELIYKFYWGKSRWLAGLAVHQWVIENGYYTLSSKVSTTGLFGLFHPTRLIEISKGIMLDEGLRPLQFFTQLNENPPAVAIFDWERGYFRWFRDKASFSQPLSANSYDKISYLYQLYLTPQKEKFLSPDITTGRRLEHYDIQNLGVEELDIDGTVHPAIHLKRATSSADMEHVDIWLSTTRHNLPVKMTYSNNAGDHFEQLISLDSIPINEPGK